MSSYSTIQLEREGGIATLTLNRPESANALSLPMATELMRAAIELDEDARVRAVILTGNGKMFCAGGDLGAFSAAGDEMPRLLKEMTTYLHAAISRFHCGNLASSSSSSVRLSLLPDATHATS